MLHLVDAYVSDELFTSRAGVRVRIGNTDAEGRMAMADVLCEMKERVSVVIMLYCHHVTMLQCYHVTVSQSYIVTRLDCHHLTLSPHYSVTMLHSHNVTLSPCYDVMML